MKIAIFHNYLDNIGGAEIVALSLARGLKADLYTTNINKEKIIKMGFSDVLSRIYSIGKVPKIAPLKQQISFLKFAFLKKKGYDFYIIAGDWAMSGAFRNSPNMWYVHSPLNELWEFKDYIKKSLLAKWKISPYEAWVKFNRKLSLKFSKSVNIWVSNSSNTKKRILKYYNKEANVIYPPIQTDINNNQRNVDDGYFLSVNRLSSHKRIELQLKAFTKLKDQKLIIVGSYEKGVPQFEKYKEYLEKIKPENVTIYHWLENNHLKKLYNNCRAFITTSMNEDFGMSAVEALASGKAVIAPNEGGYRESIQKGCGILIDNINEDKIVKAVFQINKNLNIKSDYYRKACLLRAKEFDYSIFIKKIKKILLSYQR